MFVIGCSTWNTLFLFFSFDFCQNRVIIKQIEEFKLKIKNKTKERKIVGKTIALANQKGGVGKTTTAVNLAASLGKQRKKVLLIDLDPQGNTTSGVGVSKRDSQKTSYRLFSDGAKAEENICSTPYKNLDIIPSAMELAGAEVELVEKAQRSYLLKQKIAGIKENYDFILIDCPPSLGLLTINALTACDTVLVPIQCEYYALEGLSQLMATLRQVKKLYNPYIELEGVLLTMYDSRINLTIQVANEVKKFFPKKVYKTVIPRNVRLSEAPSYGQPALYYDPSSKGSKAYEQLAKEVIKSNRRNIG